MVRGGERVIGRQHCLAITAGKVDRAHISRHDIAEGVGQRDGYVLGRTCDCRLSKAAENQQLGGSGYGSAAACRQRAVSRIGGAKRLRAGGLEGYLESVHSLVGGSEGVVGGQHSLAVAASEMDNSNVVGRHIPEAIEQLNCHGLRGPRTRSLSETTEEQGLSNDVDREIGCSRQSGVRRIRCTERLRPGDLKAT